MKVEYKDETVLDISADRLVTYEEIDPEGSYSIKINCRDGFSSKVTITRPKTPVEKLALINKQISELKQIRNELEHPTVEANNDNDG